MKKVALFSFAAVVLLTACNSPSVSQRTSRAEEYPNQEPYSKTQFERIDEPAGAESQTESGVRNPFLEPRPPDGERWPWLRFE